MSEDKPKMKERSIKTPSDLAQACADLAGLTSYIPFVLTITQGKKIRSTAANARYWSMLNDNLDLINTEVQAIEEKGYNNLEARKLIAKELPWEQSLILGATSAEVAHSILKIISGIPTSTKLGSKSFMRFEETMEQVLYEIVGSIRNVAKRADG